jgi:hypothetical protein
MFNKYDSLHVSYFKFLLAEYMRLSKQFLKEKFAEKKIQKLLSIVNCLKLPQPS